MYKLQKGELPRNVIELLKCVQEAPIYVGVKMMLSILLHT